MSDSASTTKGLSLAVMALIGWIGCAFWVGVAAHAVGWSFAAGMAGLVVTGGLGLLASWVSRKLGLP